MRGCRHSGVRVIVPPRCAPSPTRITCRYVRPQRTPHPPPLMEGEALASRVLELGPVGARFLGPVIIEVPHFAALRGKEREIVILRSDNGESWKEHSVDASEEILNQVLHDSFEADDLSQLEDVSSGRITRIVTQDFPQYFAVVSRIRQEVHAIGPEGGMVSSTVVPQVQAVFPEGALTKKIKVGLQAQPIDPELTAKLLGHGVAVSPVVTVEPRRRKFHKAITLSMPAPRAHSQGMINQYSGSAPTLRLLCSITGGTTRAQWEDVTGSTPLTFVNDCVSFTTTVSARFWLMDCRNIGDATKMATELYKEAIHVPFMAKFVVFAKRVDPLEARLRVFCMTDDKEDKTLEHQEHFTEVAKSRDVEVLEGKQQYVEFAGNLVPITKSGEQLSFAFRAFKENRLPFSVRVKDQHAEAVSRCLFMKEPKVPKGEPPQQPICILNIVLPEDIVTDTISLTDSDSIKHYRFLSENFDYYRPDPRLADMSNLLGEDWVPLANQLGLTTSEINVIKSEYPDSVAKQAQSMLRMWLSQTGNKAQTNTLENALKRIGREDIIPQCLNVDHGGQTITRIKHEEIGKYRLKKDIDSLEKGAVKDDVAPRAVADTQEATRFGIKDKYSAEEKVVVKSDEDEEDEQFDKPVAERREKIEKRLSAERSIPASSQRREIVQEITTIKQQSLVEDKLAEVKEKIKTEETTKTTVTKTTISPDTKTVSKTIEVKTTLPSDSTVSEPILSPPETHVSKTTIVTETRTIEEPSHKVPEDAELLEKVTQSFEKKKPIPQLIADEDPKSPKFSKTPPPSPADFILREQAASAQGWEASRQSLNLEPTPPTLIKDAAQQGNRTEEKSLSQSLIGFTTDRPFANKKAVYDLTNALIQSESRAEPYHTHTEKHYKLDLEKPLTDDESAPQKDDKKRKRGIFGTIKNFVGKSIESDSESEKSLPKKEKKKKDKKKKSSDLPPELPISAPRKPKLPTPPLDTKYDDIPFVEASPTDISDHKIEITKTYNFPVTDLDEIEAGVPPNITHKAREIVHAVLSDGEQTARDRRSKSPKKQKTIIIEEKVTKTFAPLTIEEEEFTITIDPTKKDSPKKTREIFTLNIDESEAQIEKEILEKSPILPEESLIKPIVHIQEPVRPIRSHVYEDILEPQVCLYPDKRLDPDHIKKATHDLIQNEISFTGWSDDKHNIFKPLTLQPDDAEVKEVEGNVTDSLKMKRKHGKLFGLFGKTSKDIDDSEDESSRREVIEKQDKETSKEVLAESNKPREDLPKSPKIKKSKSKEKEDKKFLGIFKISKQDTQKPTFSESTIKNMIDSTAFLKEEVDKYHDVRPLKVSPEDKTTKIQPSIISEVTEIKAQTSLSGKHEAELIVKDKTTKLISDSPVQSTVIKQIPQEISLISKEEHKSGFFDVFKKKDDTEKHKPETILSADTIRDMNDCEIFLKDEIHRYHDVKPVTKPKRESSPTKIITTVEETKKVTKKVETTVESVADDFVVSRETTSVIHKGPKEQIVTETTLVKKLKSDMEIQDDKKTGTTEMKSPEKSKHIDEEEHKKGLFGGMFKKKDKLPGVDSKIKSPGKIILSDLTIENMENSNNFLKDEIEKYYDVRPLIEYISTEESKPISQGISKIESDHKEQPLTKKIKDKKEKDSNFFGVFKKKESAEKGIIPDLKTTVEIKPSLSPEIVKSMDESHKFLKDEIQWYHDVRPISTQLVKEKETVVHETMVNNDKLSPKKEKVKEVKESSGVFSIFKRKGQSVERKPDDVQEKSVLSESTIKDMGDSDTFLKDEIDRYHDVHAIKETSIAKVPSQSIDSKEPENTTKKSKSKKEIVGPIFGIDKIKEPIEKDQITIQERRPILSTDVVKNMVETDTFLKDEIYHYHDVKPLKARDTTLVSPTKTKSETVEISDRGEKSPKKGKGKTSKDSGILGIFKKKTASFEVNENLGPVDEKIIQKDEKDQHRGIHSIIKEPAVQEAKVELVSKVEDVKVQHISDKSPQKSKQKSEKEGGTLFGIFKKKDGSLEKGTKLEAVDKAGKPILSETVVKDMEVSDTFLKNEVARYHDVRPIITTTVDTQVVQTEITPVQQTTEKSPTITKQKSEKDGGSLFGIFKKKEGSLDRETKLETVDNARKPILSETVVKNMKDSDTFLKDEVDRYHDVRPIITTTIETKVVQTKTTPVLQTQEKSPKKTKQKSEKEGGSLFGIFKKKEGSLERGTKPETVDKAGKPILSENVVKDMEDSDTFLKDEVDRYHDVRPIIVKTVETEVVQTETATVQQTSDKSPKKSKQKLEKESGGLFGIFKKKEGSLERGSKLVTVDKAEKPILSETVIKDMEDSDTFLKDEVDRYHDVRPVISSIVEPHVVQTETILVQQATDMSPEKSKQKSEKEAGGLFGIFKKKEGSLDRGTKLVTVDKAGKPILSETVIKDMEDSDTFLKDEVDRYHDVRPIISSIVEPQVVQTETILVQQATDKSPKKTKQKSEKEGGSLFGIFKKKEGSLERGTKPETVDKAGKPILSATFVKDMEDSDTFLKDEVDRYHDVRPIIVKTVETEVVQTETATVQQTSDKSPKKSKQKSEKEGGSLFGIFKKKDGSLERGTKPETVDKAGKPILSENVVKDMEDSDTFLKDEVDRYHDVRPIIAKTVETEVVQTETATVQQTSDKSPKKSKQKLEKEGGSLFGIFKRKDGSLERGSKLVTVDKAGKPILSETVIKDMEDSDTFLKDEIDRYHDVRPIISSIVEPQVVQTETILVQQATHKSPKKSKQKSEKEGGGLFGIFKKKEGSLERESKLETLVKGEKPILSGIVVKDMEDSDTFLKDEIKRYHDVRPIVTRTTEPQMAQIKDVTVQQTTEKSPKKSKQKSEKEGSLFGIFKKKEGSVEKATKVDPVDKSKNQILSDVVVKDIEVSDTFLKDEVERYHDVRPITTRRIDPQITQIETETHKNKIGPIFGVDKMKNPVGTTASMLSALAVQEMTNSDRFLQEEVNKYHDVKPIISQKVKEISVPSYSAKIDETPVVKQSIEISPKKSKEKGVLNVLKKKVSVEKTTPENIVAENVEVDSTNRTSNVEPDQKYSEILEVLEKAEQQTQQPDFVKHLTLEPERKIVTIEREITIEVFDLPNKPVIEQRSIVDSNDFLNNEIEKYHDVRPIITKNEVAPSEIIETSKPVLEKPKYQIDKEEKAISKSKKKETGGMFGMFKKKPKEIGTQPVSEEIIEQSQQASTVLEEEVNKHHDVRPFAEEKIVTAKPIIKESIVVTMEPNLGTSSVSTKTETTKERFVASEDHIKDIKTETKTKTTKRTITTEATFSHSSKVGDLHKDITTAHGVTETTSAATQSDIASTKPVVFETTLQNIDDPNGFLKTEVEKYHDVRPIIKSSDQLQQELVKASEPILQETIDIKMESTPKKQKKDSGLLGLFKKKSHDDKPSTSPPRLSEIVVQQMKDSDNFLKDEIDQFHDVRPIVSETNLETAVNKDIQLVQKKSTKTDNADAQKGGLFGLFKKREGSTERDRDIKVKSGEFNEPTIAKKKTGSLERERKEKISPIFGIKHQKRNISETTLKDMNESDTFLKTEVDKYHDVKPIVGQDLVVSKTIELKTPKTVKDEETQDEKGGLLGIFKKKTSSLEPDVKSVPKEVTEQTKRVIGKDETVIPEHKHDKSMKILTVKTPSLSDNTIKDMSDSTNFLQTEIHYFHDVRPVANQITVKMPVDQLEKKSSKKSKGTGSLFGMFKKKSESVEKDLKEQSKKGTEKTKDISQELETSTIAHEEKPSLSQATITDLTDSTRFLEKEVERYHDVRPIVKTSEIVEHMTKPVTLTSVTLPDTSFTTKETIIREEGHKTSQSATINDEKLFENLKDESPKRTITTTVTKKEIPHGERVKKVQTEVITGTVQLDPDILADVDKLEKEINSELERLRNQTSASQDRKDEFTKTVDVVETSKPTLKQEVIASESKPQLLDTVIRDINDTNAFLETEVDKYHDVRPVLSQKEDVSVYVKPKEPSQLEEKAKKKREKDKESKGGLFGIFRKKGDSLERGSNLETLDKNDRPILSPMVVKDMSDSNSFLKEEVEQYHDVRPIIKTPISESVLVTKPEHTATLESTHLIDKKHDKKPTEESKKQDDKNADTPKGSVFSIFKKKTSSLERGIKGLPTEKSEKVSPIFGIKKEKQRLSEKTIEDMANSNTFLQTEINKYHDVRMASQKIEEKPQHSTPEDKKIDMKTSSKDHGKKGGLFGIFKTKTGSIDRDVPDISKEIRAETKKEITEAYSGLNTLVPHESHTFLTTEIEKYHDVKPLFQKDSKPVTASPAAQTLEIKKDQMQPIKEKITIKTSDKLFESLKDESPKKTVTTTISKEEIPHGERVTKVKTEILTGTIQLPSDVLSDVEKLEKEINEKLNDLRKESDPSEDISTEIIKETQEVYQKVTEVDVPPVKIDIAISKEVYKLSESVTENMDNSSKFLDTEVDKYHDVRPVIKTAETQVVTVTTKPEESVKSEDKSKKKDKDKDGKGGLFGIFKKKGGSLERGAKLEPVGKDRPVLSDTVVKDMLHSNSFLKDEIDRYHDVRPIVRQPVEEEHIKVDVRATPEEQKPEKVPRKSKGKGDKESGGIFGIFKKKTESIEKDLKDETKSVKQDLKESGEIVKTKVTTITKKISPEETQKMSEIRLKDIDDSNNFLNLEIEKYHDVRVIPQSDSSKTIKVISAPILEQNLTTEKVQRQTIKEKLFKETSDNLLDSLKDESPKRSVTTTITKEEIPHGERVTTVKSDILTGTIQLTSDNLTDIEKLETEINEKLNDLKKETDTSKAIGTEMVKESQEVYQKVTEVDVPAVKMDIAIPKEVSKLSESVTENVDNSIKFLDTEVDKYHDVRPVITTAETQVVTVTTKPEESVKSEDKSKKKDKDKDGKGGLFGIFKKKGGSLERGAKLEPVGKEDRPVLSDTVVKDMLDSNSFLKDEIDRYHDVRPIVRQPVEEEHIKVDVRATPEEQKPEKVPRKSKGKGDKESGGIFGIFKKKTESIEKDLKDETKSVKQDLKESGEIVKTKVTTITKKISPEETQKMSEIRLKDIDDSNNFLNLEIEKYHDVRVIPQSDTSKVISAPVPEQNLTTEKDQRQTIKEKLYKETSDNLLDSLKDESPKRSVTTTITKEEIPHGERVTTVKSDILTGTIQLTSDNLTDIEKLETEINEKLNDLKKETDPSKAIGTEMVKESQEVYQKVTEVDVPPVKMDIAIPKEVSKLSESVTENIDNSIKFLDTEVDKYHDIRPVITTAETQVVTVTTKPEKSEDKSKKKDKDKDGKGGLFGIFKKKGGSLERGAKLEPAGKEDRPVLSDTVVKNMLDSNSFLKDEIDRYHDVRPIVKQPVEEEHIKVDVRATPEEQKPEKVPRKSKTKGEKESGSIFGMFKKKAGSVDRDIKEEVKEVKKDAKEIIQTVPFSIQTKSGLSDTVVKNMDDSNNFLYTEIEKYHDARPIIKKIDKVELVTTSRIGTTLSEPMKTKIQDKKVSHTESPEKDLKNVCAETIKEPIESIKKTKTEVSTLKSSVLTDIGQPDLTGLTDSSSFLETEVDKYHDVRPQSKSKDEAEIVTKTNVKQTEKPKKPREVDDAKGGVFGIFKKKTGSLEREVKVLPKEKPEKVSPIFGIKKKKPKLSEETLQNITHSNSFLQTEIDKYHDVRPMGDNDIKVTKEIIYHDVRPIVDNVEETKVKFKEPISIDIPPSKTEISNTERAPEAKLITTTHVTHEIYTTELPSKEQFDEITQKSKEDNKMFLKDEVEQFHDVRPIIKSLEPVEDTQLTKKAKHTETVVVGPMPSTTTDEKYVKETKTKEGKGLFGMFKKKDSEEKEIKQKTDTIEKSPKKEEKSNKKDHELAQEVQKPIFVDVTKSMNDSDNFLRSEIEKYHDVRPLERVPSAPAATEIEVVTKTTSDQEVKASPSKISKPESEGNKQIIITEKHFIKEGGYLNEVFVKETTEKRVYTTDMRTAEAEELKRLHETSNFLNTELDKYEDSKPEKSDTAQPEKSTQELQNLVSSGDFLRDEINNYHDVKLTAKQDEPLIKEKEKSKRFGGLFSKKKSSDKEQDGKPSKEETSKSKDKKKSKKEKDGAAKPESQDFSKIETDRYQEGKKSKEESGSFFGLFSKKTKPQEKDKSIEQERAHKLSTEVLQNMKQSSDFLDTEVKVYHDVRPELDKSFTDDNFQPVTLSPIDTSFTLTTETTKHEDHIKHERHIQTEETQKSSQSYTTDEAFAETVSEEGPKRTITTTVTRQEIPHGERTTKVKTEVITSTIQLTPDVLNDIEKLEKEINMKLEELRKQTDSTEDLSKQTSYSIASDDQFPRDVIIPEVSNEVTSYTLEKPIVKTEVTGSQELFGKRLPSEIPGTPLPGKISELSFDQPPPRDGKLSSETLKHMQDSHSFLVTELENYDDGKLEIVTDLDEDPKVKSSGLFGIFSKKDKSESPKIAKRKLKKPKEKSVEEVEKVGFLDKLGRKLTGAKYDVEEASKSMNESGTEILRKTDDTLDTTAAAVSTAIDTVETKIEKEYQKDKELVHQKHEALSKQVRDTADSLSKESDKIQQTVTTKIKETDQKLADTKQHTTEVVGELERKLKEEDKATKQEISTAVKQVENKSGEVIQEGKDSAEKVSKKTTGFFSKITGKSEEDKKVEKEKKDKKGKRSPGFLSKLGGKSKEVSFEQPEATIITEKHVTTQPEITIRVDDVLQTENLIKSESETFSHDLLKSFDEKLEHVKEERDDIKKKAKDEMKEFEMRTENIKRGVSDIAQKQTVTITSTEKQLREKSDTFEKKIDEKFSETMKLSEELSKKPKEISKKITTVSENILETQRKQIQADVSLLEDDIDKQSKEAKEKLSDDIIYVQKAIKIEKSKLGDMPKDFGKKVEKKVEGIEIGIASTVQNVEDAAKTSKPVQDSPKKIIKQIDDSVAFINKGLDQLEKTETGIRQEATKIREGTISVVSSKEAVTDQTKNTIKSTKDFFDNVENKLIGAKEEAEKVITEESYTESKVKIPVYAPKYDIGSFHQISDIQQKTLDFLESESQRTDDSRMSRAVSDYGTTLKAGAEEGARKISEANIDLSNFSTEDDELIKKEKTTSYVTSPTFTRRTLSAKITKGGRPQVVEITYDSSLDSSSSSSSYIVTEPDDADSRRQKKTIFHIESEEGDLSSKSDRERRDSSSSNVLETLTESRIESLLSDLTKDLDDSTKPIQIVLKKEEQRLKEHKKESQAEVDIIEKKLRDLDRALDSLEQVEIVEQIEDKGDARTEKKLRRVERKFERMASEVLEKESKEGKKVQLTSPEIEGKRESDYQTVVSQLSTEEISDFQKEYSHLWDEQTFSKSSDRESKTPDSQADAQELPQGGDITSTSSSTRETATTSSSRPEGEEGAEKDESEYERRVADQHQLSEEMKELLKELEKESKQ
ncbi:unnamed protein product [Diabrotica balteata]|uniref:Ankyrin-2 n=1 Tax=Diabrotica balteata TaxID=107213 RepID=A0A9N9TCH4_DIABA|nr:unnamed protein product [Diabrotica balteata]